MKQIVIDPIGIVVSEVTGDRDTGWAGTTAEIRLDASRFQPDALAGLEEFSHLEVLFHLDRVPAERVVFGLRHPRENVEWPKIGIFAQRGRARPNRVAATICSIVSVAGHSVHVRGLDAFAGSPVLDIKPVMAEFLPDKSTIRQPAWSRELMQNYF